MKLLILSLLLAIAVATDTFPSSVVLRAQRNQFTWNAEVRWQRHTDGRYKIQARNGYPHPVTFSVTVTPSSGELKNNGRVISRTVRRALTGTSGNWRTIMYFDRVGFSYSWNSRKGRRNDRLRGDFAFPWRGSRRVGQTFFGSFSHNNAWNFHAIDVPMPRGTPLYAARKGIVIETVSDQLEGTTLANKVRLLHADGSVSAYLHLDTGKVFVRRGQYVQEGHRLGLSGNTGHSTGPHLHFSVSVPDGESTSYNTVPWKFRGPPRVEPQGRTYYGNGAQVINRAAPNPESEGDAPGSNTGLIVGAVIGATVAVVAVVVVIALVVRRNSQASTLSL